MLCQTKQLCAGAQGRNRGRLTNGRNRLFAECAEGTAWLTLRVMLISGLWGKFHNALGDYRLCLMLGRGLNGHYAHFTEEETYLETSSLTSHPDCKQQTFRCSDFCLCVCAQSLSHVPLFGTPCAAVHQTPLSVGLSRQEYWSGLPFITPGNLPDQRLNPLLVCLLHWQEDSLPLSRLGSSNTFVLSLGLKML